jgi:hypothetical protein
MARPTTYTPLMAEIICAALAEGKSLLAICKQDGMPARSTVNGWLASDPEFLDKYVRAREAQADTLADENLEIADAATAEDHAVARLKIDTRKWYTAKVAPKKYGDRIVNEHTGGDKPIEISDTEAARKVAFLLAKATQDKE